MIDALGQALGKDPKIERLPPQPGDVSFTCADVSLASAELGYQPKTPFAAGLRHFVDWFRAQAK
jgi:UDP-glucuronate 4-epimerase